MGGGQVKTRDLTPKQQVKAAAKIFRILKDMGFQRKERDPKLGDYWWRKVPNRDRRVCVGYHLWDGCVGYRSNGWRWQTADLDQEPLFGYSGTTSIGVTFATVERVIDTTLERFYSEGIRVGVAYERQKTDKAKTILQGAIAALS